MQSCLYREAGGDIHGGAALALENPDFFFLLTNASIFILVGFRCDLKIGGNVLALAAHILKIGIIKIGENDPCFQVKNPKLSE